MATLVTPDVSRGNYERVIATIAPQMGLTPDQFKETYRIFPHVLKLPKYLDPGASTYRFNPRKGVDTPILGEIKLDQNDSFAADGIALRFGRATFASGVYSNHGNYPVLTYPDPAYFTGNPASGLDEWECLQVLVNGTLDFTVSSDTVVETLLAQECVANPIATYTASPVAIPGFNGSPADRGFKELTPQIIIDGQSDNQIIFSVASGDKAVIDGSVTSAGAASTWRNIVYVILSGWKIKNIASGGKIMKIC